MDGQNRGRVNPNENPITIGSGCRMKDKAESLLLRGNRSPHHQGNQKVPLGEPPQIQPLLGPIIMVRSPWPPDSPLDVGMAMATAADYAYIWGGGSIIAGLMIGNVPGVIGGIAVGVPYLSVGVFMIRQTYLWYKNHPNRGVF